MKACAIAVCVCLLAVTPASASYVSGFENLVGSPVGTVLTGQDGFYLPVGTSSVDYLVYTYQANALGLPANPTGGLQFIGGTGPGDGTFYARAQHDADFSGGADWTLAYDFCATFMGTGSSANNVGSFSVQNGTSYATYIHLMSWVDPATPTTYNAFYLAYDAAGTQFVLPGASPGPAWAGLEINHWYRGYTIVDLAANKIAQVGIIDLETMQGAVYYPADWYLAGGAAGAIAPPSAFRFFAGGGLAGVNALAFDNASIVAGTTPVQETSWGVIKAMFR
jgi:hypothetical protein